MVVSATTIVYEPTPYFSASDSPFYGGIVDNAGNGIWLEDFEDGQLNTPNVRAINSFPETATTLRTRFGDPGPTASWGVDGDDGVLDGNGFAGDVWISSDNNGGSRDQLTFEFLPDAQGRLPTYVGFVIARFSGGISSAEVDWLDVNGDSIYDTGYRSRDWARDPITGQPMEGLFGGDARLHRFVGLYHEDGIAGLYLEKVDQLDHLQYGFSIPEPSITSLFAFSALGLALRRKRNLPAEKRQVALICNFD